MTSYTVEWYRTFFYSSSLIKIFSSFYFNTKYLTKNFLYITIDATGIRITPFTKFMEQCWHKA